MTDQITKHYQNGNLRINWEPAKCIHAGICARELPSVFRPQERPWVKAEAASADRIAEQIDKCPSGALSYTREDDVKATQVKPTQLNIADDGPILMSGPIDIQYKGDHITIEEGKKVALCRCGASKKKPYCDGTHSKIDFEG